MYAFHVTIQGRPAQVAEGEPIELRGRIFRTLAVRPETLSGEAFSLTFEQVEAALAALPRLFIEPDGSFVWVADDAEQSWQVDGQLYDRAGRLLYVDLQGRCPAEHFDQLLRTVGWPEVTLIFQLTREAVYLDEAGFRRYAAA